MVETTDWDLVERLQNPRDHEAWQAFHDLYRSFIEFFARNWDLQPADVDDVTQETLLAIKQSLPGYLASEKTTKFRYWLRGIVINKTMDKISQLCNCLEKQEPETSNTGILAGAQDLHEDQRECLFYENWGNFVRNKCLEALSSHFKPDRVRIFDMNVFMEMPAKDVAAKMAVTCDVVYTTKQRGMEIIKPVIKTLDWMN